MPGPRPDRADDARRSAEELTRAAEELRASVRRAADSARDSKRAASASTAASVALASVARKALQDAVAEAKRSVKDISVEVKVERLSREESRQRTRERLLDAAAEVFNREGYHGASLEAVAEAAGFTKGAVYSNFATKGELFAALLKRYTGARLDEQGASMEAVSLGEYADEASSVLRRHAAEEETWDLLQVEFWLAAMRDPVLRDLLIEGHEDTYRVWGERFERKFAEAGVQPPFSGAEFARLVNALSSGLLLQVYLEPEAVDPSLISRAIRALAGAPIESGALRSDGDTSS
jgi:AcrR family transcriptional regulator